MLMLIGTYFPQVFNSPLQPFSTLGPLVAVLSISMLKELLEDAKRHRSDKAVNTRLATVLKPGGGMDQVAWKDLSVGTIVVIPDREEVPADMIVLQTSEAGAQCYVETSNIDGETDLKLRYGVRTVADAFPEKSDLARISGTFQCDHPNDDLLKFVGSLDVPSVGIGGVVNKNVVLRGSSVRNTHWIAGMVVYAGQDTKVMKKAGSTRSKMSQVERTMNSLLGVIFLAQFALCTLTTIAAVLWQAVFDNKLYYLATSGPIYVIPSWLAEWFTFLILFNNFIPISLYVTVEMVNYVQAYFVDQDASMYDPTTDTPAKARTSNINQDLGQIEYIFSDKTGTLTRNIMEFKMFSTGQAMFGQFGGESGDEGAAAADDAALYGDAAPASAGKDVAFADPNCAALLAGRSVPGVQATPAQVSEFFETLALCHTVVPEWSDQGELTYQAESPDEGALVKAAGRQGFQFRQRTHDSMTIRVRGQDQRFGWLGLHEFNADRKRMSVVLRRPDGRVVLLCKGADSEVFKYCHVEPSRQQLVEHLAAMGDLGLRTLVVASRELPPEEARAWAAEYERASALAQGRDAALAALASRTEINMTVMGATAIEDRLQDGVPETIRDLGRAGIKTWVLTGDKPETAINIGRSCQLLDSSIPDANLIRIVSGNEGAVVAQLDALAREFKQIHDDPRTFLDKLLKRDARKLPGARSQRKLKLKASGSAGRARASSSAALLGDDTQAVSVVPSTGPSMASMESGTIQAKLARAHSQAESKAGSAAAIIRGSDDAGGSPGMGQGSPASPGADAPLSPLVAPDVQVRTNMAVVVTGAALYHIIGHPEREKKFLITATLCKAVIACRVSPGQKANVIGMVKDGIKPRPMTLAIGDGANDVNMIQEAEVGVGISGKEGLQAVNASDFAIAQFRFLKPLLLVHGRWSYVRMCKVVLYSFYKNVVITLTLFCFNSFAGFSGTSFFESLVYSGYNFFLGLPIIMVGLFDRDLSKRTVLSRPEVYMSGLYHMNLNIKSMIGWLMHAFAYAMIVFFLPWATYAPAGPSWSPDGVVDGLSVAGQTTFTCLVLAMQLKVALPNITTTWAWPNHLFFWLSILGYFIFLLGYSSIFSVAPQYYGVVLAMMSRAPFWFVVILTLGAGFAFDLALEHSRLEFLADEIDGYVEAERRGHPFPRAPWADTTGMTTSHAKASENSILKRAATDSTVRSTTPVTLTKASSHDVVIPNPATASAPPSSGSSPASLSFAFKGGRASPTRGSPVRGAAPAPSSLQMRNLSSSTPAATDVRRRSMPTLPGSLPGKRSVVEVRNVLAGMSASTRAVATGALTRGPSASFAFSYPTKGTAGDEEGDDIYG